MKNSGLCLMQYLPGYLVLLFVIFALKKSVNDLIIITGSYYNISQKASFLTQKHLEQSVGHNLYRLSR